MSALNFPDDPTEGEQYTDPTGKVWIYNGTVWNALISGPATGATGISGFSGETGATGISGFSGETGATGISGFSGVDGVSGFSGISGFSGQDGIIGTDGATGATGTSGFSGQAGASGFSGQAGESGFSGQVGESGFSGQIGESGFSGQIGESGFSGQIGESGFSGQIGESGFSGEIGESGFSGETGTSGFSGETGTSGFSGETGATGTSGFSGQAGESGFSGLGTSGFSGFSGSSSVVTISDSAPVSPTPGELWWDSDTGNSYIRYDDCTSNQWVLFSTVATENPPENIIYSWGCGAAGQLGDNTTINRFSPVSVIGGFTDWSQVSGSGVFQGCHSLGVRQNGTAWAWGNGFGGKLGDSSSTYTNRSSPVSVVGGFTNWCQISAGGIHSLGVRTNGTAWAWGSNGSGRLGDGTTVNKSSPVSVVGGFTDWCQVSGGAAHSLGVRTNGTVWAWGQGSAGQLGDNTIVSKRSPVSVVGGFTNWCQVSAGADHSLGVRQNGTAWAWGCNGAGRLGDNTITNRLSPVQVVGGFTDWCQVAAGGSHSLAVRQNGTAWAWGYNGQGRLGDNTTVGKSSPVQVVGGFTDWCQMSAGQHHSLAVRQNGTAWAWGRGSFGRLGQGHQADRSSPVSVIGGFTDWSQVSGGYAHSLAIRSTQV